MDPLSTRLRTREFLLGSWVTFIDPTVTKLLSKSGSIFSSSTASIRPSDSRHGKSLRHCQVNDAKAVGLKRAWTFSLSASTSRRLPVRESSPPEPAVKMANDLRCRGKPLAHFVEWATPCRHEIPTAPLRVRLGIGHGERVQEQATEQAAKFIAPLHVTTGALLPRPQPPVPAKRGYYSPRLDRRPGGSVKKPVTGRREKIEAYQRTLAVHLLFGKEARRQRNS